MKFYHNWMVLGPMRSGTLAVGRALLGYKPYMLRSIRDPNSTAEQLLGRHELVHSHDLKWLNFVNSTVGLVICIRNPIECALSRCILPKYGQENNTMRWHFFQKDAEIFKQISENIEPFYLSIDQFQTAVDQTNSFYQQFVDWPNWRDSMIVDYTSWSGDHKQLFPQLGIRLYNASLPLKNPGTPEQWILNLDEIMDYSKSVSLENYHRICQRN
jgi:hypothetical protein